MRPAISIVMATLIGCLPVFTVAPPCGSSTDVANCGTCGNVCGNTNADAVACTNGKCGYTCSGVFAHCSNDDSTGCETNLGTSVDHCGACGHSCGGGQCVAGKCTPVILAGDPSKSTGLKSLYGMVAFGGYVFGTNWERSGGLVYRVPSMPGNPLEWLVGQGEAGSASLMATDGNVLAYAIYYTEQFCDHLQGLWMVAPDGTSDTRVIEGDGTFGTCQQIKKGNEVDSLAFDGTYIYLTHSRDAGSPCNGIVRANPDGTGQTLFLSNWRFSGLVADSGSLYFINITDASLMAAVSTTLDMPITLAKQGSPSGIATDDTYLYWSDVGAQKFFRTKKVAAGMIQDITPPNLTDKTYGNFLVDETYLYFVSPPPMFGAHPPPVQRIYRTKKDGSEPATPMATLTIDNVTSFTQDKTALYWGTYGDDGTTPTYFSAIYKLVK